MQRALFSRSALLAQQALDSPLAARSAPLLQRLDRSMSSVTIPPPACMLRPLEAPLRYLFGPGPSNVPPRILAAGGRPIIGHLHPEMYEVSLKVIQIFMVLKKTDVDLIFLSTKYLICVTKFNLNYWSFIRNKNYKSIQCQLFLYFFFILYRPNYKHDHRSIVARKCAQATMYTPVKSLCWDLIWQIKI